MNAKGKLSSLEQRARRAASGAELSDVEKGRREREVAEWVEFRAGLRRPLPAVLGDGVRPAPPFPPAPINTDASRWADALDAAAVLSMRKARTCAATGYPSGVSEGAKALADRLTEWFRAVLMIHPQDVVPWWMSDAPLKCPPDPEADTLLAVVRCAVGFGRMPTGDAAVMAGLFATARTRLSARPQ